MSRGPRAPSTPATVALAKAGVAFTPRAYTHDPAVTDFGREAAEALGVAADRVFKTLVIDLDGALVVGIVPIDRRLDLKLLAAALGGRRAQLADPAVAERRTGYVVGGISPIGMKVRLPTALDASALDAPTLLVSGGRRGFDIELRGADLVALTHAVVAGIAR